MKTEKSIFNWLTPLLLLLLGSLNILFGALQIDAVLLQGAIGGEEFASPQYLETPIPIMLHIVAGILFNLLGPLQFAPITWQRWSRWHRWSGRMLVGAGIIAGLTGVWMNHFFPQYGGPLKYPGILIFGLGQVVTLVLALMAIRQGDVSRHRAWMMRAIAIGLGPATQRLIILPIFFILGGISDFAIGLLIWGGFLLNLIVVEWILSRQKQQTMSSAHTVREIIA